jgi:hypothetical protein
MTAALEGSEWSAARPGRTLTPGKTRYPLYRRLGGPQGRSGRAENLVSTGIRSRTVQPVVSRYTDWATRPTIGGIPERYWMSDRGSIHQKHRLFSSCHVHNGSIHPSIQRAYQRLFKYGNSSRSLNLTLITLWKIMEYFSLLPVTVQPCTLLV